MRYLLPELAELEEKDVLIEAYSIRQTESIHGNEGSYEIKECDGVTVTINSKVKRPYSGCFGDEDMLYSIYRTTVGAAQRLALVFCISVCFSCHSLSISALTH